jgi:hypothetical protein
MEFNLTPVPGAIKDPGNIYQSTKLVVDPQYVVQLKQFDQRMKGGVISRKGRLIEGIFVESKHLNSGEMLS